MIQRARIRALERREQAIDGPAGISTNGSIAGVPKAADPIQADLDRIAQLSASANSIPRPMMAGSYPSVGAVGAVSEEFDLNQQNGKRKFQQEEEGDYLKTTRIPPISRWVVELATRSSRYCRRKSCPTCQAIWSQRSKTMCMIRQPTSSSRIPAGALLAGEYNSSVSYGQGARAGHLDLPALLPAEALAELAEWRSLPLDQSPEA